MKMMSLTKFFAYYLYLIRVNDCIIFFIHLTNNKTRKLLILMLRDAIVPLIGAITTATKIFSNIIKLDVQAICT